MRYDVIESNDKFFVLDSIDGEIIFRGSQSECEEKANKLNEKYIKENQEKVNQRMDGVDRMFETIDLMQSYDLQSLIDEYITFWSDNNMTDFYYDVPPCEVLKELKNHLFNHTKPSRFDTIIFVHEEDGIKLMNKEGE